MLTRIVRRLNWSRHRWTVEADLEFHDEIFKDATYDPTDISYPGAVTIRRFADLAAPHVAASKVVADLGCGPGEITCELARRFEATRFIGVDHSARAVDRARALAARMALTNVEFVASDVALWKAECDPDLLMMFDAFHHLPAPKAFVANVRASTRRFFLIEPRGNWYGAWQKDVELDWVAETLFEMRDRLAYSLGVPDDAATPSRQAVSEVGDPIERRYPLEDLEDLFEGFGLDVVGTVAGIERYGTRPEASSDLRREVGDVVYRLFVDLDTMLRRLDLDLAAKHWAIYAEQGRVFPKRTPPVVKGSSDPATATPKAYAAAYALRNSPSHALTGETLIAEVTVTNLGWRTWSSAETPPVLLSSRMLDGGGRIVVSDGPRASFPEVLAPGASCVVFLPIQAPAQPGRYQVLVDGVHEGVTWFSQAGAAPLSFPLTVAVR
jgi:SAM-dependent methyltransferase